MLAYDVSLTWASLLLLAIGLVMVYSASIAMAEASSHTGYRAWYFLVRHAVFVAFGLLAAFVTFQVPIKVWRHVAVWFFAVGAVLLVLVLVPGIGKSVNGSKRWISLVVLIGGLLLLEPDFGAFVVILAIAFGILFVGGLDWRLFLGLAVLLPVALAAILIAAPYRVQRLTNFLDPWSDPLHKGYQLSHSLIAFGRGEWFGVGLGASVEKLLYLPEAHTDFLLAVIAEELGFVGVAAVIGLFAWLLFGGYAVGRQAALRPGPLRGLVAP